jgi:hypothetical protein
MLRLSVLSIVLCCCGGSTSQAAPTVVPTADEWDLKGEAAKACRPTEQSTDPAAVLACIKRLESDLAEEGSAFTSFSSGAGSCLPYSKVGTALRTACAKVRAVIAGAGKQVLVSSCNDQQLVFSTSAAENTSYLARAVAVPSASADPACKFEGVQFSAYAMIRSDADSFVIRSDAFAGDLFHALEGAINAL